MADVYIGPFITDARDCVCLASHPETFFKAMDALKPYVLTVVTNDYAHFRLIQDEVNLVDLRKKLEHLNNLGYKTNNITFTARYFMGWTEFEMSDLEISWFDQKALF